MLRDHRKAIETSAFVPQATHVYRFARLACCATTQRPSRHQRSPIWPDRAVSRLGHVRRNDDDLLARGDAWVLNGEKKWIGIFADINIIWARDESSNQVKGFVVGKDNPGFAVKKIEHKMALRVVQNGLITLKATPANAKLPASQRTPASCSLASDRMFTTGI
jgi:hypothetical protein